MRYNHIIDDVVEIIREKNSVVKIVVWVDACITELFF